MSPFIFMLFYELLWCASVIEKAFRCLNETIILLLPKLQSIFKILKKFWNMQLTILSNLNIMIILFDVVIRWNVFR